MSQCLPLFTICAQTKHIKVTQTLEVVRRSRMLHDIFICTKNAAVQKSFLITSQSIGKQFKVQQQMVFEVY